MAQDALAEQPTDTLVELFFDCEEPEERDALFDVVAARGDGPSHAFLAAVMAQDDDPYLRVAAARALLVHDVEGAREYLFTQLQRSSDELLFEDALTALLERPGPGLFEMLIPLAADDQRDIAERRLVQVALAQLDESRALKACRALLSSPQEAAKQPLDVLSVKLSLLVRSGTAEDAAIVDAAIEELLRTAEPGPSSDDSEALLDAFVEARALMAAAPGPIDL